MHYLEERRNCPGINEAGLNSNNEDSLCNQEIPSSGKSFISGSIATWEGIVQDGVEVVLEKEGKVIRTIAIIQNKSRGGRGLRQ